MRWRTVCVTCWASATTTAVSYFRTYCLCPPPKSSRLSAPRSARASSILAKPKTVQMSASVFTTGWGHQNLLPVSSTKVFKTVRCQHKVPKSFKCTGKVKRHFLFFTDPHTDKTTTNCFKWERPHVSVEYTTLTHAAGNTDVHLWYWAPFVRKERRKTCILEWASTLSVFCHCVLYFAVWSTIVL